MTAKPTVLADKATVLAEGKHLRLMSAGGWEYAERRGVSGIVTIAADFDGQIVLVEQFRKPVAARVIELPAGLAGDLADAADESLQTAAARELVEETGFTAAHWELVCSGPTSAGMTTEIVTFFRARGLTLTSAGGGDASEDITIHLVPLTEATTWLDQQAAAGRMVDPKVYLGVALLANPVKPKPPARRVTKRKS